MNVEKELKAAMDQIAALRKAVTLLEAQNRDLKRQLTRTDYKLGINTSNINQALGKLNRL